MPEITEADVQEILMKSYLISEELMEVAANDSSQMVDSMLFSYLSVLSHYSQMRMLVISPLFGSQAQQLDETLMYGDINDFDVCMMPLHTSHGRHWILAYFDRRQRVVKLFDPSVLPITRATIGKVRRILYELSRLTELDDNAELTDALPSEINEQIDSNSCGYHVCLVAERLAFNESTRLDTLDIIAERHRVNTVLENLLYGRLEEISETFSQRNLEGLLSSPNLNIRSISSTQVTTEKMEYKTTKGLRTPPKKESKYTLTKSGHKISDVAKDEVPETKKRKLSTSSHTTKHDDEEDSDEEEEDSDEEEEYSDEEEEDELDKDEKCNMS